MNENDYKSLIIVYQQKSFDLFSQVVALEAKMATSYQLIESLTLKINELKTEIENIKTKNKKTSSKLLDNSSTEDF